MLGKETSLRVAIPYTAMYSTLPAKLRTMEVTINNNLNLNHNIDYVCTKTISNTAFLQRNLSSCPGKRRSCVTHRHQVKYSCSVWDPLPRPTPNKLESVQRSAARYVLTDYQTTSSVPSMIQQLGGGNHYNK